MKHVKKLLSAVLVLVLALTMVLPVAAEGETTYSIKIQNDKTGHTYEAYQIFAGDLSTDTNGAAILSNITWGSGVDATKAQATFGDANTKADALNESNAKEFATQVSACLATSATGTANTQVDYILSNGNPAKGYVISNLEPGYYLIKDMDDSLDNKADAYTAYILEVVKDVEATPKSDVPTAEKKVQENSEKYDIDGGYRPGYNDVADYNIGDTVPFSFYSTVPDMSNFATYKYIFHDDMSDGLTFNQDSVKVHINNSEINSGYKVALKADGNGFTVTFDDLKTVANKDDKIRIDFTATLNENAAVGLPGNPNTMTLEYSNNPNDSNDTTKGNPDTVIVFTYEIDVNKVDGENHDLKLEGVQFKLYKEVPGEEEGADPVKEYVTVNTNGKVTGWTTNKEADGTTLTTANGGTFAVSGLDDGTYFLEETQPKDGYNTLAQPVKLEIKATTNNGQEWTDKDPGTALTALTLKTTIDPEHESTSTGDVASGKVTTTVENYTGATLPSTGGIGTTIFYVVGGILVVGAAVLLIAKKRTRM